MYVLSCVQPASSTGVSGCVGPDGAPCVGSGSKGLRHGLFPFCGPETCGTVVPEVPAHRGKPALRRFSAVFLSAMFPHLSVMFSLADGAVF